MLSREQIRAGRAMLDWSQGHLAKMTGEVSTPTIKLIESGKSKSTDKTLEIIKKTFEDAGLEFLPDNGLRKADKILTVLEKQNEDDNIYLRLLDDVYYTMRGTYGEVLHSFIDNKMSPPEVLHKEKLIRDDGITFRSLVRYGDTHLTYPLDEYRYLPKGFYINNPVIIYGDKAAFAILEGDVAKIVILKDSQVAKIKKNEFEIIWSMDFKPETKQAKEINS